MSLLRLLFAHLLLLVGAFSAYVCIFGAFQSLPEQQPAKYFMVIFGALLAAVSLTLAGFLNRRRNWRRSSGIALLAAAGLALLIIVSDASYQDTVQLPPMIALNDYAVGGPVIMLVLILGGQLLWRGIKQNQRADILDSN
ncbi:MULTISPECIES: hypothetical protein [Shewanella]|jgi:peptidoglycan/LPS O-acetylase OafA/YrhL|uniref:Uncharacterized protein n=2 Tax=Shewanella indica TaxID=768528 RepID=A0ABU4QHG2_9GAMM|nr:MULTISPECIES: hypothetical protein [Shewanella]MDX6017680.1 hypothetical protein [Shewanella indica]NDO72730.1 hypothetical protein [Shewanella sp. SE1]TVP14118.1 hypothetical protein AYI96_01355 [Shewanella sp. MSW]BCV36401.1 hypothetical protein TUM17377_17290 [Shewanella chilikensis]